MHELCWLPIGWPAAKVDGELDLWAGRALEIELFDASHVSRRCACGRGSLGAPSWAAAMWMRLGAIKPIAMRLEKTINSF
jgi:hypothetical protein